MHLGRFFTDEESRHRMPVAVVGADIEKGLFANMDPIGKTIHVDGHEFTGGRHHAAPGRVVFRRHR